MLPAMTDPYSGIRGAVRALSLAAAVIFSSASTTGGEWIVRSTPLFDVYCPADSAFNIDASMKTIEKAYARSSDIFRHQSDTVIRIVLNRDQASSSPEPFAVSGGGGYYQPAVAGVAEIPFCHDEDLFFRACVHELSRALLAEYFGARAPGLGWFIDGAAWYAALDFDEEAASAACPDKIEHNADLLKRIPALRGYVGRRAVQAFLAFLESSQGPDAARMLAEGLREGGGFSEAVRAVTGLSGKESSARFLNFVDARRRAGCGQADNPSRRNVGYGEGQAFILLPLYADAHGKMICMARGFESWSLCVYPGDAGGFKSPAGGRMDEFYSAAAFVNRRAAVSQDGSIYTYVSRTGSGETVFIGDCGTGALIARKTMPFRAVYDPELSPDGGMLVFSGFTGRRSELYLYRWREDRIEQLTSTPAVRRFPSFNADGASLLYSRREITRKGISRYCIFTVGLDGKPEVPVHADGRDDLHPRMSGNGKKIVFTSIENGASCIKSFDTDTGAEETVKGAAGAVFPLFTPGGDIVYSQYRDGVFRIFGR